MKFRWGIVALLLVIGAMVVFWPKENTLAVESVPSVAATEDFFKFPWGASPAEVAQIAKDRNLESSSKGILEPPRTGYRISFAGYPAEISFYFLGPAGQRAFYQGSLTLNRRTCPVIEQIYWQLHSELTQRYGPTPEMGYPPRRNSGDEKPWGSGSGAIWEIKSPDGQLFEIEAKLDSSNDGFLQLTYFNISMHRRFMNSVNPTPDGDPTQAPSALKGFMDIPWGASPARLRQGLEANGFSAVKETTNPIDRRAHTDFSTGTYAGYPVNKVSAYFHHNAMYMVSVEIRGEASDGGEAVYNNLKAFLAKQYGAPLEAKNFRQETVHIWQFPLEGFKPNSIMLHRPDSTVIVTYKNEALEDKLNNL